MISHPKGAFAASLLLAAGAAVAAEVLGTRPDHAQAISEDVPNAAALGRRIWVPGLDDGYVPQGLTVAEGHLLVSAYHPTPDAGANLPACRVYRIEMATGNAAGSFDLPAGTCSHAGGLAYLGGGKVLLADTRRLFRIDLDKALAAGKAAGATQSLQLAGELRGSFAGFDGRDFWIGTWTKDASRARIYRLAPRLFDERDGLSVDESQAAESFAIPSHVQGATFDRAGHLWLSASSSQFGTLYRLDLKGVVLARHEMVAGLEDLAFDGRLLWGMSESGAHKYRNWPTHFPYLFEIDPARLR